MKTVISKLIDLCEGFNFVNMDLNYFGLDLKLQGPTEGYLETKMHPDLE
jgi:hypothetical protein